MMGPYWYGGGWGWMALGWIMMLVFWALVIIGIVAIVRWASVYGHVQTHEKPVEILRRRYAAGEITREQFEAMKQDVA